MRCSDAVQPGRGEKNSRESSCPVIRQIRLHDESECREDTRKDDSQAIAPADIKSGMSSIGLGHGRFSTVVTESVVGDCACAGCRWCAAGGSCGVDSPGVLGAARVFLNAGSLAGVDAAAGFHALLTPFDADVEGDGQGVLGHVWGQAVAANALVCQLFLWMC